MKNINKIKIIILTLTVVLLIPALALAVAEGDIQNLLNEAAGQQGAGFQTSENLAQTGVAQITGTAARLFISLLGVVFVSYTIYGGYLWMTAAGNEEKITKARKIIRDGIIGLIVVLSAAGIYLFVKEALIITSQGPGAPG